MEWSATCACCGSTLAAGSAFGFGGLAEDVLDHRLNSRMVLINPIGRWIYWNSIP